MKHRVVKTVLPCQCINMPVSRGAQTLMSLDRVREYLRRASASTRWGLSAATASTLKLTR